MQRGWSCDWPWKPGSQKWDGVRLLCYPPKQSGYMIMVVAESWTLVAQVRFLLPWPFLGSLPQFKNFNVYEKKADPVVYVPLDFWWGHHPFKVTRRDRNPYGTPRQIVILFWCMVTQRLLVSMGDIETNSKKETSLLRRIQARCKDLTVNQWLDWFDPSVRSKAVFMVRSYNGYYRGLSIRRWEFDSPTHRQF